MASSTRRIVAMTLALGCALWVSAAGSADATAHKASAAGVKAAPVRLLRYGVLASFPPFQIWPQGGVAGGADLEIVSELARNAGLMLQPVRYADYPALEADLLAGRIQLASSMARTPERDVGLLFSPPYSQYPLALLTRADQPSGALQPDLAGRSIAVVRGYASQDQADRLFPVASRVVVRTPREGVEAVRTGRADALLESLPVLSDMIEREQIRGLIIARRIDAPSGRLHLAYPRGEVVLAARLNAALQAYSPYRIESLVEAWSAPVPDARLDQLDLSDAERQQLAAWPAPRIGVVGQELPFAVRTEGGSELPAEGLSVDMLRAVLGRLNVTPAEWVFIAPEDLPQALAAGRVDILIGADEAAERALQLRFVGPFIEYPTVLIGRPEGGAFDLVQLYGRRLALPPASAARPFVESRHPGVKIVDCGTVEDCVATVRRGDADATLADVVSAAVAMARNPRADVQIIGAEPQLRRFHSLALADRHAAVVPLFKRALDVAVQQDMPALKAHWLSRPLRAEVLRGAARRYGPWAAGALLLLTGLTLWHTRRLRAQVRRTRAAQQAAERLALEKGRFTTFLAHEVRNSLHAVIAGTELARIPARQGPEMGTLVAESARSTLRLLNNIVDRERVDAGRLMLHTEPALLGPLVQAVVNEMQPAADLRGLPLRTLLPNHRPRHEPLRVTDPLRLQQVLRNLLANAIKYSPQGTVEVEVLPLDVSEPQRVVIEVRDRGRGIDVADLETLFEPFGAAATAEASAGLGLTISRDLARLMGGDLTLAPRAGGGSVARLQISAPVSAAAIASTDRVWHVLVVEDAEIFALLLSRAFEQRGHVVQLAGNILQAQRLLAAGGINLLLTDLHLPDGTGSMLLQWVQDSLPAPRPVLLAMTADRDSAGATVRTLPGVVALLEKTGDARGLVDRALLKAEEAAGADAAAEDTATVAARPRPTAQAAGHTNAAAE